MVWKKPFRRPMWTCRSQREHHFCLFWLHYEQKGYSSQIKCGGKQIEQRRKSDPEKDRRWKVSKEVRFIAWQSNRPTRGSKKSRPTAADDHDSIISYTREEKRRWVLKLNRRKSSMRTAKDEDPPKLFKELCTVPYSSLLRRCTVGVEVLNVEPSLRGASLYCNHQIFLSGWWRGNLFRVQWERFCWDPNRAGEIELTVKTAHSMMLFKALFTRISVKGGKLLGR